MDIYMKKIKQRADETDNVMGKIKANKMAELDKLQLESEIVEVEAKLEDNRAKIRASKQTGQALAPQQAHNVAELLFAGRPPEEIKQIMDSLDETSLDKLAYLTAAMNGQQLGAFTQTLRRPETNVKDTIELINTVVKMNQRPPEQQGITLQGIAALMKEIREGQAQSPQQPQQQGYAEKYLDLLLGELKTARQEQSKDREARLEKEIAELKNRPGFMDELTGSAEKFQKLQKVFGSPGGKTDTDLKHEEMQQTERLENRKLDIETKKWEYEQENSGKTIEQVTNLVKTVAESPIGRAIENMGSGFGERLKTGKNNNAPQLVKIQCPNCFGQFSVNPALPQVSCIHCGSVLQAKPSTPQPEIPPVPQEPQPQLDTQQTQTQESQQQESSQSGQTGEQPPAQ